MRTVPSITKKKNQLSEMYGYFFGKWNKLCTGRYNGPTKERMGKFFPLKDKTNVGYLKTFFPVRRSINDQRNSNSVWYSLIKNVLHWKIIELIGCALRLPKVTKIATFVNIVAWKQARRPPLFITFLISPCPVMTSYQVSSDIYGGFLY